MESLENLFVFNLNIEKNISQKSKVMLKNFELIVYV